MLQTSSRRRAVLNLCRASNAPTVWSNVLAGWFLAAPPQGNVGHLLLLLAGSTLLYFGGVTLNDAFDAAFDRCYRPERPIPSGILPRWQVFALGIGWTTLGSLLMLTAGVQDLLLLLLIASIVSYNTFHKRTYSAAPLMGAARGLLILTAGSANGLASLPLWVWAIAHFTYITGLTWHAASESGPDQTSHYAREQTLLLLTPIAAALSLLIVNFPGLPTACAVIALTALFVWFIHPALPTQAQPLPPFKAIPKLLLAIILIDTLALSAVNLFIAAIPLCALLWLAIYLQKKFAAT